MLPSNRVSGSYQSQYHQPATLSSPSSTTFHTQIWVHNQPSSTLLAKVLHKTRPRRFSKMQKREAMGSLLQLCKSSNISGRDSRRSVLLISSSATMSRTSSQWLERQRTSAPLSSSKSSHGQSQLPMVFLSEQQQTLHHEHQSQLQSTSTMLKMKP